MDQQTFQQAIGLLSGEHSLTILRSLRDGNWHLSSEVARTLDIHTTTASKFLQRVADLGLVERQAHDSRTFEYRVPAAPRARGPRRAAGTWKRSWCGCRASVRPRSRDANSRPEGTAGL